MIASDNRLELDHFRGYDLECGKKRRYHFMFCVVSPKNVYVSEAGL